ncbi:hypothetical protein RI129_005771, partial [Pyrocoelia pectoralis]
MFILLIVHISCYSFWFDLERINGFIAGASTPIRVNKITTTSGVGPYQQKKFYSDRYNGLKLAFPFNENVRMYKILLRFTRNGTNLRNPLVSEFLYILNNTYNFQIECMHLIGVSFGAHIAGMVGNLLKVKYNYTLGRITGLDPLGAGYNCVTCKSLRLNKGDAKFVDVIHTNPGRIGELRRVGDIDFYVNWPYYWSYKADLNFNTCSSVRSAALYAESVRYQNFRATSCHSLVGFSECFPTDHTYMGLYAKPSRYGVYYV